MPLFRKETKMFKVAILGCENSHANQFLDFALKDKALGDIEVVGVYSDEEEAMAKLKEAYGVNTASSCDEFVGKVDGIVITARHGDNHYKYAKPYIESGIPMFIDKPITISEKEGVEFMRSLKASNVKVTGGSSCIYQPEVVKLKEIKESGALGKVFGGFLRAPNMMGSPYGGFYFYSQHLVQTMTHIFGNYPLSVSAFENGDVITSVVRYKDYDVTLVFANNNFRYYASINCEEKVEGEMFEFSYNNFLCEFTKFSEIMKGNEDGEDYRDFIAPVFILNAICRSLENNGAMEMINPVPEI